MEAQLAYPGFIPAAEAPQRGAFVIRPNPRVNPAGRGAKVRRFPRTMEEASLADKYLMDVPEGGWRVRQELRPDGRRGRYSAWREVVLPTYEAIDNATYSLDSLMGRWKR